MEGQRGGWGTWRAKIRKEILAAAEPGKVNSQTASETNNYAENCLGLLDCLGALDLQALFGEPSHLK